MWFYFGGGLEKQAERDMDKIYSDVAADAVAQYYIAKRNGNPIDAYVQAGLVCAAYLQAGDESSYKRWKEIQRQDAEAAGLPN